MGLLENRNAYVVEDDLGTSIAASVEQRGTKMTYTTRLSPHRRFWYSANQFPGPMLRTIRLNGNGCAPEEVNELSRSGVSRGAG